MDSDQFTDHPGRRDGIFSLLPGEELHRSDTIITEGISGYTNGL